MKKPAPTVYGIALFNLRRLRGISVQKLAERTRMSANTIWAYENGDLELEEERFEELARILGAEADEIERLVFAASLLVPPPPRAWTPVDPTPQEQLVIDRAAVTAARDAFELFQEHLREEIRQRNRELALEEGRKLAKDLLDPAAEDPRERVRWNPDFHHWGLAVALCAQSEAAAAHDLRNALFLAELALLVAGHVSGTDGFKSRLQGYCTAAVGNVRRVRNEIPAAGETFDRALRLWNEGEDPAGLLSQARMLDLEASLRRAERHFDQALKLHAEALKVARPEEEGHLLLNQSSTLQHKGNHEEALETLERAARVIDGERQPRLRFGLRFNQSASLTRLNRAAEAAPIVAEVRELAERLRNDLDLCKTLWLEANVAAGLGRRQEALESLEQVRRDLQARALPYDYALASLDVALLYRQEGRCAEIKALAAEMLAIFRVQGVHREALASVLLFKEAAEREEVTIQLVRRLQDYLDKARANPALRFEG
jgi:transcriptional regulator with XRE-family HTH domain